MKIRDFAAGVAAGATLSYILDAASGRRRRALAREKTYHAAKKVTAAWIKTEVDMRNRARGLIREALKKVGRSEADDRVIAERVRSAIGRAVSNPGAIEVAACDGHVSLSGPILLAEKEYLLKSVAGVQGVDEIESNLEEHETRESVPGLQAQLISTHARGRRWSLARRVFLGSAGAAVSVAALRQFGILGLPFTLAGAGVLSRAVSNKDLRRLFGVGGRGGIEIFKSIRINAPAPVVYDFWSRFDNFPQFLSHVREVRRTGNDNEWRWTVSGPGGISIEWDAWVTESIPGKVIAWESAPGSDVRTAGIVHFADNGDGTTRVDVRLSYTPLGGTIGHALAKAFGSDPKSQMNDDLARMKTYLETGRVPHDAAALS